LHVDRGAVGVADDEASISVRGAEVASGTSGAIPEGRASNTLGVVSRTGPAGAAVAGWEGAPMLTTGADRVAVAGLGWPEACGGKFEACCCTSETETGNGKQDEDSSLLELVLFPGIGSGRSKNSAVYCAPVF
jgi:hypothetical protein